MRTWSRTHRTRRIQEERTSHIKNGKAMTQSHTQSEEMRPMTDALSIKQDDSEEVISITPPLTVIDVGGWDWWMTKPTSSKGKDKKLGDVEDPQLHHKIKTLKSQKCCSTLIYPKLKADQLNYQASDENLKPTGARLIYHIERSNCLQ